MRVGGQSPQSASAISGVTGTQPSSVRLPVLQNHWASCREKSKGRNRAVPSGARDTKPWVPPPSMCPPPMTPSTVIVRSVWPSWRTTKR